MLERSLCESPVLYLMLPSKGKMSNDRGYIYCQVSVTIVSTAELWMQKLLRSSLVAELPSKRSDCVFILCVSIDFWSTTMHDGKSHYEGPVLCPLSILERRTCSTPETLWRHSFCNACVIYCAAVLKNLINFCTRRVNSRILTWKIPYPEGITLSAKTEISWNFVCGMWRHDGALVRLCTCKT